MRNTKHIEIVQIITRCKGGTNIHDAAREALIMAIDEGRQVVFTHNDRQYTVNPYKTVMAILNQHPAKTP